MLTRRNDVFRHYYLSSSLRTIERWVTRFRHPAHERLHAARRSA
jgi:hypothetical protein